MITALPFRHVIAADFEFEFGGNPGNRPRPVCLVAKDLCTGQTWRLFRGKFDVAPPFPIGRDALFIAVLRERRAWLLGWPMPANVLDLFVEFRNRANGLTPPAGFSLIG